MTKLICLAMVAVLVAIQPARAEDWPQWGGPRRDNVSGETGWAESWPADGPPVLWTAELGAGDGQVAVSDGHVYSLGLFAPDGRTTVPVRQKSPECAEVLLCLDEKTGAEKWRKVVARGKVKKGKAWEYEHSVPSVHDGRVYVRGCWGTLACFDAADGESIWLLEPDALEAEAMDFGYQGSALVSDGRLFSVVCGAGKGVDARLVAVNARSGARVWERDLGTRAHAKWAPPAVGTIRGRRTLVMFCQETVMGLDPAEGTEIWSFNLLEEAELPPGPGPAPGGRPGTPGHTHEDENPPQIVGDMVLGEFRRFQKRAGNVTVSDFFGLAIGADGPQLAWTQREFVNSWDSQAVRDGMVYGITRRPQGRFGSTVAKYHYRAKDMHGALECYRAGDGELVWSTQHLTKDSEAGFQAAVFTIAGDRIFGHDERRLAMGRIGGTGYEPLAATPMKGKAAAPVASNGRLFVRMAGDGALTCFDAAEGINE